MALQQTWRLSNLPPALITNVAPTPHCSFVYCLCQVLSIACTLRDVVQDASLVFAPVNVMNTHLCQTYNARMTIAGHLSGHPMGLLAASSAWKYNKPS
jgi:hypothetical protein